MSTVPVGMSAIHGCLVVPLPAEVHEGTLAEILEEVLRRVEQERVTAVIVELSAVAVMDRAIFRALRDAVQTLRLLGAATVLAGFQPGVVAALVDLDLDLDDLHTARTVEQALALLRPDDTATAILPETAPAAEADVAAHET
jgi:anti-anti-sigma regulatory factor